MRTTPFTGTLQNVPTLHVRKLDPRAKLPERDGVGFDVFAFLLTESGRPTSRAIHQKGVTQVPTGIAVRPEGQYYIQICPRLSLARKAILIATAPGIIDATYDGELLIMLFNGSFETHYVAHEHRIARLIVTPHVGCNLVEDRGVSASEHQEDVHPGPR